MYLWTCVSHEDSYQPAHLHCLIRAFAGPLYHQKKKYVYPNYLDRQVWPNFADPDQMQQNVASGHGLVFLPHNQHFVDTLAGSELDMCIAPDKKGYPHITFFFFLFLHKIIWCGYSDSLEVPQWGTSNEYPQHCLWRKKKISVLFSWKKLLIWSYASDM